MAATQEFKTIDQVRTRLHQLSSSINLLRHEIESSPQLPSWPQLQTASQNLASTLQNVAQVLSSNRELLSSAHVYPNPSFPGQSQEGFLQQLLRKKMDPKAEDWMDRELDKQANVDFGGQERGELWDWAGGIVKEMRADLEEGMWGDYFTLQERKEGVKGVKTGIQRRLDFDNEDGGHEEGEEEGEEEGDEVEDEVMGEDSAVDEKQAEKKTSPPPPPPPPPIPLETLLRFATGSANFPGRAKT